jgi:hypoxanthine-guanine phosphoribosyltransferase
VKGRKAAQGSGPKEVSISAARIASRVAALGRVINREFRGRRVDVVVTLDRGVVFGADLIRQIDAPVVCHFLARMFATYRKPAGNGAR